MLRCSQVAPFLRESAEGRRLSVSSSQLPTPRRRRTAQEKKLFVTIIVRAGPDESEGNGEKGPERVMDCESRVKVKQIDSSETLHARTQGYDILYHRQRHQHRRRAFYVTSKWRAPPGIPRLLANRPSLTLSLLSEL